MINAHHKKKHADILVGYAHICAGTATDMDTGRIVRGWHLPGYGFTTSEVRARAVAETVSLKIRKALERVAA